MCTNPELEPWCQQSKICLRSHIVLCSVLFKDLSKLGISRENKGTSSSFEWRVCSVLECSVFRGCDVFKAEPTSGGCEAGRGGWSRGRGGRGKRETSSRFLGWKRLHRLMRSITSLSPCFPSTFHEGNLQEKLNQHVQQRHDRRSRPRGLAPLGETRKAARDLQTVSVCQLDSKVTRFIKNPRDAHCLSEHPFSKTGGASLNPRWQRGRHVLPRERPQARAASPERPDLRGTRASRRRIRGGFQEVSRLFPGWRWPRAQTTARRPEWAPRSRSSRGGAGCTVTCKGQARGGSGPLEGRARRPPRPTAPWSRQSTCQAGGTLEEGASPRGRGAGSPEPRRRVSQGTGRTSSGFPAWGLQDNLGDTES